MWAVVPTKLAIKSDQPAIALDGQFLITRGVSKAIQEIKEIDGRLVIAINEDETRYFKRLRCRGNLVLLESLNQDGEIIGTTVPFYI